ncbi:MAG: hypothetical protein NC098_04750 [Lachnoclostridium sp.]|nr:hypothetical protein [Lachnoclostridium sp.]
MMKQKIKIILMAVSALCMASGTSAQKSAAKAIGYYRYDPAKVSELADQAVDTLKADALQKEAYKVAVTDAFSALVKRSDKKVKESEILDQRQLLANADTTIKSLNERLKLVKDSLALPLDSVSQTEVPTAEQNLIKEIETLKVELTNANADTLEYKEELARAMALYNEKDSIFKSKEDEANAMKSQLNAMLNDSVVASVSAAEDVLAKLHEAAVASEGPLANVDTDSLGNSLNVYRANRLKYEGVYPADRLKAADADAEIVSQAIDLAGPIKKTVEIMKGRYNKADNDKAHSAIAALVAKAGDHKAEVNEIADALGERDRAYRNVTYLLNQIDEMGESGFESDFDIDYTITKIVELYSDSGRYSEYYVRFNDALKTLSMKIKGKKLSGDKIKKITKEIRETI